MPTTVVYVVGFAIQRCYCLTFGHAHSRASLNSAFAAAAASFPVFSQAETTLQGKSRRYEICRSPRFSFAYKTLV